MNKCTNKQNVLYCKNSILKYFAIFLWKICKNLKYVFMFQWNLCHNLIIFYRLLINCHDNFPTLIKLQYFILFEGLFQIIHGIHCWSWIASFKKHYFANFWSLKRTTKICFMAIIVSFVVVIVITMSIFICCNKWHIKVVISHLNYFIRV